MAKTTQANPLAVIPTTGPCDMSLAGSGDYLRRVKLAADLTDEVKKREAVVGDFIIQGVSNLGQEVKVVLVKARPHALQLTDGSSKVGAESYDMNSPEFQQIRKDKDANPGQQDPNNMYGYDFLLWLPEDKTFVTYFLCKMSLFKSVPAFTKNLGKLVTMASREEHSKKNAKITYRVPTVAVLDEDYATPTQAEYDRAIALFDNPRVQRAGESAEQTAANSKGGKAAKSGGRKGR